MDNSRAELLPQQCLKFNGIVYLPHYQDKNKFVSPGYGHIHFDTYSGIELLALGASIINEALWLRAWGGNK